MRRTNLPGHALRSEGAAYKRGDSSSGWVRVNLGWPGSLRGVAFAGVALCQCGWTSALLESNGQRKRAHAIHKDEIRANEEGYGRD